MNYLDHYNRLIKRAKNRKLSGYFERHHIVPHCVGGGDEFENIVELTPEEHYVAHQLLVKIYPHEKGLLWATMIMTGAAKYQPRKNKIYGWLRRKVAEHMKKPKSAEVRAKLSAALKGRKYSPERCANISAAKKGKKRVWLSEKSRLDMSFKLRQANLGKKASDSAKAKMRAAKLGKKQSLDQVEKTRLNMLRVWKERKLKIQQADLFSGVAL